MFVGKKTTLGKFRKSWPKPGHREEEKNSIPGTAPTEKKNVRRGGPQIKRGVGKAGGQAGKRKGKWSKRYLENGRKTIPREGKQKRGKERGETGENLWDGQWASLWDWRDVQKRHKSHVMGKVLLPVVRKEILNYSKKSGEKKRGRTGRPDMKIIELSKNKKNGGKRREVSEKTRGKGNASVPRAGVGTMIQERRGGKGKVMSKNKSEQNLQGTKTFMEVQKKNPGNGKKERGGQNNSGRKKQNRALPIVGGGKKFQWGCGETVHLQESKTGGADLK